MIIRLATPIEIIADATGIDLLLFTRDHRLWRNQ